jgi:hypothetical protein
LRAYCERRRRLRSGGTTCRSLRLIANNHPP